MPRKKTPRASLSMLKKAYETWQYCGENQLRASQVMGVPRTTLQNWVIRYKVHLMAVEVAKLDEYQSKPANADRFDISLYDAMCSAALEMLETLKTKLPMTSYSHIMITFDMMIEHMLLLQKNWRALPISDPAGVKPALDFTLLSPTEIRKMADLMEKKTKESS